VHFIMSTIDFQGFSGFEGCQNPKFSSARHACDVVSWCERA
jgi:hypothetical protein